MGRKVLVLGGTRYFGKRLVRLLFEAGDDVTLATRGQAPCDFKNSVHHLTLDRADRDSMKQALKGKSWDLVYDQICYCSDEADIAREIFENSVSRYVHTSTGSVYPYDGKEKESDFDPYRHPLLLEKRDDNHYGERKMGAEALFFQKLNAWFPDLVRHLVEMKK